jgi:hypothetical protein
MLDLTRIPKNMFAVCQPLSEAFQRAATAPACMCGDRSSMPVDMHRAIREWCRWPPQDDAIPVMSTSQSSIAAALRRAKPHAVVIAQAPGTPPWPGAFRPFVRGWGNVRELYAPAIPVGIGSNAGPANMENVGRWDTLVMDVQDELYRNHITDAHEAFVFAGSWPLHGTMPDGTDGFRALSETCEDAGATLIWQGERNRLLRNKTRTGNWENCEGGVDEVRTGGLGGAPFHTTGAMEWWCVRNSTLASCLRAELAASGIMGPLRATVLAAHCAMRRPDCISHASTNARKARDVLDTFSKNILENKRWSLHCAGADGGPAAVICTGASTETNALRAISCGGALCLPASMFGLPATWGCVVARMTLENAARAASIFNQLPCKDTLQN